MDRATQSITLSTAALFSVLVTLQYNAGLQTSHMLMRPVLQQQVLIDVAAETHTDMKQYGQPCVEHRSMTQC